MNHDLDETIRGALTKIAASAPDAGTHPPSESLSFKPGHGRHSPGRSRRSLTFAVAAAIVVGLGGLVAVSSRTPRPDIDAVSADSATSTGSNSPAPAPTTLPTTSQPVTTEPAELSNEPPLVDPALQTSPMPYDWVIPAWLPDGYAATAAVQSIDINSVTFDHTERDATIVIVNTKVEASATSPSWTIEQDDAQFFASTASTSNRINVSANDIALADFERLLESVTAIPDSDVPADIWSPVAADTDSFIVAEYLHTTSEIITTMSVQVRNGRYCVAVGGSGYCDVVYEPEQIITPHGGGATGGVIGEREVTVVAHGIASPLVATVQVTFIDGQTITVPATDLSGRFDDKFWVATAQITLDEPLGTTLVPPQGVDLIAAFDAEGQLLATDSGDGVSTETAGFTD